MTTAAPTIGLDDSLLGGFTIGERVRIKSGENFAVWGWKDIARAIERGRRTAIELAARDEDPLLVEWEGERVFARAWGLIVWRQNQRIAHKYHREHRRLKAKSAVCATRS